MPVRYREPEHPVPYFSTACDRGFLHAGVSGEPEVVVRPCHDDLAPFDRHHRTFVLLDRPEIRIVAAAALISSARVNDQHFWKRSTGFLGILVDVGLIRASGWIGVSGIDLSRSVRA